MKVALYVPWIYQKGGVERTLVEYLNRTRHDVTLLTNHYAPNQTFPELAQANIKLLSEVPVTRGYADLIRVSQQFINQKMDLSSYDALIIFTSGFAEFITIHNHLLPLVCYCSTPLKVIHDPKTKEAYLSNPIKRVPFFFMEKVYRHFEKESWKHFDVVLSNSEETKRRILAAQLCDPKKIQIENPGMDYHAMKQGKVFKKYFFVPGRFIWHKNFELAIDAFKLFHESNPDFRLVIAGDLDSKNQSYLDSLQARAKNFPIDFVTRPNDKAFFKLFRESYAVLFTAINEDFGMVPLEAMSFGKPVLSVNEGGPLETIVDGKTGYLVDKTPQAFATQMISMAKSPTLVKKLGTQARRHAARYDWSHYTRIMDDALEQAKKIRAQNP